MKQPPKHPMEVYIEGKKAEQKAAVEAYEAADQLIEKLGIEINALERAYSAIRAADEKPQRSKSTRKGGKNAPTKRGRSLSSGWKAVLVGLSVMGARGASLDEIASLCEKGGISLKRPTLRAQMSNYVKAGYLERVEFGRFSVTLAGLEVAGAYIADHEKSAKAEKEAEAPR
jgi:hypothetical protein